MTQETITQERMSNPESAATIDAKSNMGLGIRSWKRIILSSMFFGYSSYYVARKSFTFAMPALLGDETLALSKEDLGAISSSFMIWYAISKFFGGVLSDKISSRVQFAFGLAFSGLLNIAFSFSNSVWMFTVVWCINGFYQGFGWPPCAQLINEWFLPNEAGDFRC